MKTFLLAALALLGALGLTAPAVAGDLIDRHHRDYSTSQRDDPSSRERSGDNTWVREMRDQQAERRYRNSEQSDSDFRKLQRERMNNAIIWGD